MPTQQINTPSIEDIARIFPQYQNFTILSQKEHSVVYKALEISPNREVALKISYIDPSKEDQYPTLLEQTKNLASINNTAVAKIYNYGQAEDYFYISMEYIHGKPLHNSIYGITIDTITATQIIQDICSGLEAAHSKGISHQELTPDNIIIGPDAKPRLINFSNTQYSNNQNTLGYSAPEIANNSSEVNKQSDIYSVGIILKQMLTGTVAPHFNTDVEGDEIIVEVPEELQTVINTATAQSPSSRYSSIATMALILRELMEDLEDEADSNLKTAAPAHLASKKTHSVNLATSSVNLATRKPTPANINLSSKTNYSQFTTVNSSSKSTSILYVALLLVILGGATFFVSVGRNKSKEVIPTVSAKTLLSSLPVQAETKISTNTRASVDTVETNDLPDTKITPIKTVVDAPAKITKPQPKVVTKKTPKKNRKKTVFGIVESTPRNDRKEPSESTFEAPFSTPSNDIISASSEAKEKRENNKKTR